MSNDSNNQDESLPKGFSGPLDGAPVPQEASRMEETTPVTSTASEHERMYDFFNGRPKWVSEIILAGNCPKCFDSGRHAAWVFGRGGGKKCLACGWQD